MAIGFCIPAMIVPALPDESSTTGLNGTSPLDYPWIAKIFRAQFHWGLHNSVFASLKYCMMILLYGGAAFTTLPLIPVIFGKFFFCSFVPIFSKFVIKQLHNLLN